MDQRSTTARQQALQEPRRLLIPASSRVRRSHASEPISARQTGGAPRVVLACSRLGLRCAPSTLRKCINSGSLCDQDTQRSLPTNRPVSPNLNGQASDTVGRFVTRSSPKTYLFIVYCTDRLHGMRWHFASCQCFPIIVCTVAVQDHVTRHALNWTAADSPFVHAILDHGCCSIVSHRHCYC